MNILKLKKLTKKVHRDYYSLKKERKKRMESLAEVAEEIGYLVSVKDKYSLHDAQKYRFVYYDDGFRDFLEEIRSVPKSTKEYEIRCIQDIIKKHVDKNNFTNIVKREVKNVFLLLKTTVEGIKP